MAGPIRKLQLPKDSQLNLRVSKAMHDVLRARAEAIGESVSTVARMMLAEKMRADGLIK